MSDNHGVYSSPEPHRPVFVDVDPGRRSLSLDELTGQKAKKDWWMGQVIHCGGAARDQNFCTCSRSLMWIQV